MGKKAALHNLGCKVNAYETEAMQQLLQENGYEIVDFAPGADIYIINTCTVTNIADRKSRQMIHKAKKMNPDALVVAAGCYVQAGKEKIEKDASIDIIIGNNKKKDLINILKEHEKKLENRNSVIDINHTKEYEELYVSHMTEHTRAYIKVQDGCNQFCTYCIIPYARGRVRSRHKEDVLSEVRRLAEAGCREIVLTGIHLSSYGADLQEGGLPDLIQAVHRISGIERIRLGSLEPGIVTEEFAAALAALPKVCPHFHLSLQSGCDGTLKRMNRRYDAKEYQRKCALLRRHFRAPALTTDVIVGFPGETPEEFEESRKFVEGISFYETHIFKYSRREGTKAADMEHQVSDADKTLRSNIMIQMGKEKKKAYMEQFLGQTLEILIEEQAAINGESYWVGYTPQYLKAAVRLPGNPRNTLVLVRICRLLEDEILLAVSVS